MKKVAIAAWIVGFFLFSSVVFADEQNNGHSSEEQTMSQNMTSEEHMNMNMSDTPVEEENSSHGEHNAEVQETPPNLPVLAVFGAINAGFIIYGFWKKQVRKKEALA